MIKKKYIQRAYVETAYCDECGAEMAPTGIVLTSFPPKYQFKCTNKECNKYINFLEEDCPGKLKYEFEKEEEKKYKIIALIGEAGSGKDTLMKNFLQRFDTSLHEIISHTSRPPRDNEENGINYYFKTKEEFLKLIKEEKMLEYTEFNNWYYGTGIEALEKDKVNIGVFNPEGIRKLLKNSDIDLKVFRIICPAEERLKRQLYREKSPNVDEIIRRYLADEKDFKNLDFDYISLENTTYADMDKAFEILKPYLA